VPAENVPQATICATRPAILVGATYLDTKSGGLARVVDAQRSAEGATGLFVVESANGERPGERWLCLPAALVEEGRGAALPCGGSAATLFRNAAELLSHMERLPTGEEGRYPDDVKRLTSALRAVAAELDGVLFDAQRAAKRGAR
jgi:hypothetical protein